MCGIAAVVTRQPRSSPGPVPAMVEALQHRGPDSQATHHFGRCTLGSARLSIVDVEGGTQPILSDDGKLGVAFNGAIYGFREMKSELAPYRFHTDTDTEVILALYARHGRDFVTHLPGMFGFALWDDRQQTLTCARDRFGEKPVYYAFGPAGEFLVASEIKALLASGLIQPVLNREAVSHYLSRLHVHPAQTIYSNVHVLPPAHVLRFHNGRLQVERYWNPPDILEDISMEEAVGRFQDLFTAAVRKQLVADVPVGVLLSGGLDSSTVAAVVSQQQAGVNTFSFGFNAGVESELPFARGTAARCGTRHFEAMDDNIDVANLLRRMQTIYDEPLGDSSTIPTFLVCELARRHVTVALGGDGADELLGGYLFWSRSFLEPRQEATTIPPAASQQLMQQLARWFSRPSRDSRKRTGSPLVHRYAQEFRNYFPQAAQQRMGLTVDGEHLIDYSRYGKDAASDMLRFDAEMYLPGDILVKTDRAAMASGLELRAPFLDVDVASFCLSLPDSLKIDDRTEKLLLRRAYETSWTPEVRAKPKQGFGSPMSVWLQSAALRELKHDTLGDRRHRLFNVLDFEAVQPYIEQNNQQTWSLLVLALWMETHACAIPAN